MSTASAHGAPPAENGHVSFSELVRAHHEFDREGAESSEQRFRGLLAAFEAAWGDIVDAYWCRKDASAVALTRRELVLRGRLLRRRRKLEYRLHRVSDWVVDETHELADLLHDCDILAIKAAHSLDSVPRAVVMQWLLLVESHLLGFIERHREGTPDPAEVKAFAASERAELKRIEEYYFRAGEKRARMRYVEGMMGVGVGFVAVCAAVTAVLLSVFGALDLESAAVREFYACAAAGGVGAIISALMRMSGRGNFVIDHELARHEVILVGAYRPLIGSVSGIVIYFLITTPFVPIEESAQTFPFFVVVAFLAGFSERWTRMVLSGAMRTIGDREPEPEAVPAEQKEKVETPPVPA